MSKRGSGGKVSRALWCMIAGGLCGAGIALLYAPSSGDRTRQYLRMKTEWARRRAGCVKEEIRETIDHLIADMREISARLFEEGRELSREAQADILSAIESGKRAMDEEKERLGCDQTGQRTFDHTGSAG